MLDKKEISKAAKVLSVDVPLITDWQLFYEDLEFSYSDIVPLRNAFANRTTTSYSLLSTILTHWNGQKPQEATLPKIVEVLDDGGFGGAAELLRKEFELQPKPDVVASNHTASVSVRTSERQLRIPKEKVDVDMNDLSEDQIHLVFKLVLPDLKISRSQLSGYKTWAIANDVFDYEEAADVTKVENFIETLRLRDANQIKTMLEYICKQSQNKGIRAAVANAISKVKSDEES